MPSMMKKRRREQSRPTIHPKNKYAECPPDFALLASLYPSFKAFVFYSNDGRPRIDWTDFNATRELTRVLLHHDHGLDWWIPDGQLCPTVPNRSNYIHWIEDLLSSDIIPRTGTGQGIIRGFDIGTGANCIYPLLGASLKGWSFVGSDVTNVALEWAERNVKSNPHISELIEIRKVEASVNVPLVDSQNRDPINDEIKVFGESITGDVECLTSSLPDPTIAEGHYSGPPILCGVVMDDERFDFCMCNPPFFQSMEEAGLNPKTACGGTPEEMVCPGGEKAFISCLIDDSVKLKQSFRWYTSMVGRKANLKSLTAKLRAVGVTIVRTTEFVQGQTCRWGVAWSFVPPIKKIIPINVPRKNNLSFMLEGLQRQLGAIQVLQAIESFFRTSGASCTLNVSSFSVDIIASNNHLNGILKNKGGHLKETSQCKNVPRASNGVDSSPDCSGLLSFCIMVFQQIPGTLLVKGSLQNSDTAFSGAFFLVFQYLEEDLKQKFGRQKESMNPL